MPGAPAVVDLLGDDGVNDIKTNLAHNDPSGGIFDLTTPTQEEEEDSEPEVAVLRVTKKTGKKRKQPPTATVPAIENGPYVPAPVRKLALNECAICVDTMSGPASTKCGHLFCKLCIMQALRVSKKCPICRKACSPKDIRPIFI
jgi:hypothetical protein